MVNFEGGCAISADERNQRLNKVFAPAAKRETVVNFQSLPELRHPGGELKRNMTARGPRRNGYDDARLRPVVSLVRYQYSLAGLDTACHQDQGAGSIDGDCVGLLVERIATYAADGQGETDGNATRGADVRVPGSRCFSDCSPLAFEAQRLDLTYAAIQSRSTGPVNSSGTGAALVPSSPVRRSCRKLTGHRQRARRKDARNSGGRVRAVLAARV